MIHSLDLSRVIEALIAKTKGSSNKTDKREVLKTCWRESHGRLRNAVSNAWTRMICWSQGFASYVQSARSSAKSGCRRCRRPTAFPLCGLACVLPACFGIQNSSYNARIGAPLSRGLCTACPTHLVPTAALPSKGKDLQRRASTRGSSTAARALVYLHADTGATHQQVGRCRSLKVVAPALVCRRC